MANEKDSISLESTVTETSVSIAALKSSLKPELSSADSLSTDVTSATKKQKVLATEVGGRGGLEPTRFGDWEKNGRCIDF